MRTRSHWLASCLVIFLSHQMTGLGKAQGLSDSDVQSPLQTEFDGVESIVVGQSIVDVPSCPWCCQAEDHIRCGGCVHCGGQSDLKRYRAYAGLDITFLRPYLNGLSLGGDISTNGGRFLATQYDAGYRLFAGVRAETGFGARLRYWTSDFRVPLVTVPNQTSLGDQFGIDMDVLDGEITMDQRLSNFDMRLSAGVRFGRMFFETASGTLISPSRFGFEGAGPTSALELHRKLGDTGLSLIANGRGSLLIGSLQNPIGNTFGGDLHDELTTVLENQLGLSWDFTTTFGMQFHLRAVWETQFWKNSTLANSSSLATVYNLGSNLGFSGPAFTVTLTR